MALQPSGVPISFKQIREEFGIPPGKNLGAYRVSQTVGELTRPLDDGIPTSGTIKFSDFYSKRLNIVVYCSGNRVTARSLYNTNSSDNIFVIGGYKSRPASSSGSKVWIHTNETISSNIEASSASSNTYCSLITGTWNTDTDLRLDIGSNGIVNGAGGNGGNGGAAGNGFANSGSSGRFGTSAIGVNYQPIIIINRGTIQAGYGGGGGGGGASAKGLSCTTRVCGTFWRAAGGGGGGGGAGTPGGRGGTGGSEPFSADGKDGVGGGSYFNGDGGAGGESSGVSQTPTFISAKGGNGGSGGAAGSAGIATGSNGLIDDWDGEAGSAGAKGYGIIISNDGTGVTIQSGGSRDGDIVYSITPT